MSLTTLAHHQRVWDYAEKRKNDREAARLQAPFVRLWDGDYNLRGIATGWRELEFEFIENDVGMAKLVLPVDHYLSQWVLDHKGRWKRNVHITIEKQGARWSGVMDHYKVIRTKEGDSYTEIVFVHDLEHTKHILCWANPFLRPEYQFPKLWVIFGPAKWCLLTTLFVNILRLETSLWTIPDNPLDIKEWIGPSFWPGNWRQIVKPFPLLADNSNLTVVFSRFKTFYDVAKNVLEDAQLSLTCRRYLKDEDPHPFGELSGEMNIGIVEDVSTLIPLRHGCLVWDIVDRSGWGGETAFGGSLLTGLVRAIVSIASDGLTEGVDVFTEAPQFPGDYYIPNKRGTRPEAPWVVFEEGRFTGIESSEFLYYEATDTSVVTGGHSMPGINEAISCVGVNTVIDGPDGKERIGVLAQRGGPFRVWSITPEGEKVAATALFAFKKGTAHLCRYTLANGSVIEATAKHRWLTPDGWREAGQAVVGSLVGVDTDERFSPVVSIDRLGVQDFYDMHVPVLENYLAEGIWNHNTGINMAGDYLTSIINSALASLAAAPGAATDLPPLGGVIDAVARIFYEDVALAFMEIPSLRAASTRLPIAGLEDTPTSLGDYHFYEGWADGADRAFTISALVAARSKFWQTRARTAHTIKVSDAAPYYVGDNGQGDFWLGDRVAVSVFGYPDPNTLFVERVNKIRYKWDKDGPSGWTFDIGRREPKDPAMKAFEKIREINSAVSQLGVW